MMEKSKGRQGRCLSWLLLLLLMLVIYYLSSQPLEQTHQLSMSIAEKIYSLQSFFRLEGNPNSISVEKINWILRKLAHFLLFCGMGLVSAFTLDRTRLSWGRITFLTLLICILYAASDELHQMYVLGRTPSLLDVLLDGAGAVVGIGIYRGLKKMKHALEKPTNSGGLI